MFIPAPCNKIIFLSMGRFNSTLDFMLVTEILSGMFLTTLKSTLYFWLNQLAMLWFTVMQYFNFGTIDFSKRSQIFFFNGVSCNSGTSQNISWLSYTKAIFLRLLK